jgi:uncharacterized membrane protein
MKKHFRLGLGLLVPVLLVAQVLMWGYGFIHDLIIQYLPDGIEFKWYFVFLAILIVLVFIYIVGIIFSFIKPIAWIKHKIDKHIIDRIPVVNKIYSFGKDLSDSFITDIKEDGNLQVVEIIFAGHPSLGVLTDEKHDIIFVPTAPNPLNGYLLKTKEYKKIDMSFIELIQSLASLGKTNGKLWK